ncbi:MAG: murein biosynthesis integral membrane protein MurJ [Clostridiales Family XIII bacterium]|nr:murein biosynthesis integral membrane protein MurJ [Clostridiales Family XIII bacterium]
MKKTIVLTAAQTTIIMAILTLVSKLFGFVRETLMANYYGTSAVVDALNMANSIPTILFAGFFTAVGTSFMPLFSKSVELEGKEASDRYTSKVMNLLILMSIAMAVIFLAFAPQFIKLFTMPTDTASIQDMGFFKYLEYLFAHGWTGEKFRLAVYYLRVSAIIGIFSSFGGVFDTYLSYKRIYITPVILSYLLNIVGIAVILMSHTLDNPYLLAFSLSLGQAIKNIIAYLFSKRKGFRYTFSLNLKPLIGQITKLSLPIFFSTLANQINIMVDRTLASGLITGSIAALGYGSLLVGLFTGLTGAVITSFLYPRLSESYARGDTEGYKTLFDTGVSLIMMLGIPCTLGALTFAGPAVQIVFERGSFNAESTAMTTSAFFFYGISIVFMMLLDFFNQAHFARHNTVIAFRVALVTIATDTIISISLVGPLKLAGLALGSSIASVCGAAIMGIYTRHKYPEIFVGGLVPKFIKICIASVVSVGIAALIYYPMLNYSHAHDIIMPRTVLLMVAVAVAAGVYLLELKRFKVEEIHHLKNIFGGKVK